MRELNSVYVSWQAPDTREWHVVGVLVEYDECYAFKYTKGAAASNKFVPFSGMEDLSQVYYSKDLFPLFSNRVLSPKRPEYPRFVNWLGFEDKDLSPVQVLGRSGGLRGTDQLQLFKKAEVDPNGELDYVFFVHGLSHLSVSANDRVSQLKEGDQLYLCLDCQNDYDENAVLIRADDPAEIIGFCPRYLSKDVKNILCYDSSMISVYVEAFSKDAPANYRLMCRLQGSGLDGYEEGIMCREEFKTIAI